MTTRFPGSLPIPNSIICWSWSAIRTLAFGEEGEPEILTRGVLADSSGWQGAGVAADDRFLYVAQLRSRTIYIRKYAKEDLSRPLERGYLYDSSYLQAGGVWSLTPVSGVTIIGMTAADGFVYVFAPGVCYKTDRDFSLCRYEDMSADELEAAGAVYDARTGGVEVQADFFDADRYSANRLSATIVSVAFDAGRGRFYAAASNTRSLLVYDLGFQTLAELPLADVPETASAFLHRETGRLYLSYEYLDRISAVDVSGETPRLLFTASADFYITDICVTGGGQNLRYLSTDNLQSGTSGVFFIKTLDLASWPSGNLIMALTVAGFAVAALALVAAVILAVLFFGRDIRLRRTGGEERESADLVDRAKKTLRKAARHWVIYLVLFVSLAGLVLFTYYPGVASLVLSLFEYSTSNPSLRWNDFANFAYVFQSTVALYDSWVVFRNMFIYLFADLFVALVPPVLFAMALTLLRFRKFSTVCRILLYIPGILPGIAGILIWMDGIYGTYGVLNYIIRALGGETYFFLQQDPLSVLYLILMGFPFVGSYLVFYGGLMNIPTSYYEAAELDGCSVIRRLIKIDIPLITPQLKYVFVWSFIGSVQNFTRVRLTTSGSFGSQTIMNAMYDYLSRGEYGISAAYAAVIFIFLLVATLINLRLKTADAEG